MALAQIALEETKGHPSIDGIESYIDMVSQSVEEHLIQSWCLAFYGFSSLYKHYGKSIKV